MLSLFYIGEEEEREMDRKDLEKSCALQDNHKDNKRIVVPMFQRGKRWNRNSKEITYI